MTTKVCIFINKDDERLLPAIVRDETTNEISLNEKLPLCF